MATSHKTAMAACRRTARVLDKRIPAANPLAAYARENRPVVQQFFSPLRDALGVVPPLLRALHNPRSRR
jgi:hypothetical protein